MTLNECVSPYLSPLDTYMRLITLSINLDSDFYFFTSMNRVCYDHCIKKKKRVCYDLHMANQVNQKRANRWYWIWPENNKVWEGLNITYEFEWELHVSVTCCSPVHCTDSTKKSTPCSHGTERSKLNTFKAFRSLI